MVLFKKNLRWLQVIIGVLLTLYLGACATFYTKQNQMLYHPTKVTASNQKASVAWQRDGQTLRITQIVRMGDQAIMYFGGNAEDVLHTAKKLAQVFPERSIYALNYRGYSGSTGEPSEQALIGDAVALFDKIHETQTHVQVMGRSLGSGVAVQLAHARPVERLALVTPYDSIVSVAHDHFPYFPMSILVKDKYRSVRYAPDIKIPVTLLVAGKDTLIPPNHAMQLAQKFPPESVKVITFEMAEHNSISREPDFWPQVTKAFETRNPHQ